VKYTKDLEEARITFYRKFFKVSPSDSTLYHLMLNMDRLSRDVAADMIINTVDAI